MENHLTGIAVFVEVVKSGSFTAAASNLGHTSSYVSKKINKLEERLGTRLLQRTTRRLKLTNEGEIFYQHGQQIIDDIHDAENAISGKQGQPKGRLRVSCPVAFGLLRLQPLLNNYLQHYPGILLDLNMSDQKVDLVAEGYDVVIRASQQLDDSSLVSRQILQTPNLTLASPSYLQQHGTPQHPHELSQHRTIGYANRKTPDIWHYHEPDGREIKVKVPQQIQSNNSDMNIALAKSGQGIINMPAFNLNQELQSGVLTPILRDYQQQNIGIYMIYPSRKHVSARVRSFIDFVTQHIAKSNLSTTIS